VELWTVNLHPQGKIEAGLCRSYCNEICIIYEGVFVTGGATTIHLKVIRISKEPSPVQDHHVPVFIEDQHMFRSEQWDLTTYQVILRGSGRLRVF
jgi:hypothetical protein